MKRIFQIIAFPFSLIFQFILLPFKILKIILDDKTEKRKDNDKTTFRNLNQEDFIEIGKYLFAEYKNEFSNFYNSFLKSKKTFLIENKELFEEYKNFKLDKLKAIEVIYIFGNNKQKLSLTDWRGEENEGEIENFIEDKLQIKSDWKNVNELRKNFNEEKQRDGEFIVKLLETIDKDLKAINKRLIFLNLGWDAYIYTVVDQNSYKTLTEKFRPLFN